MSALNKRFQVIVEDLLQHRKLKSQSELAELYGCGRSFIGQMKLGKAAVPYEMMEFLYKNYNVSADYLVSGVLPIYRSVKRNYSEVAEEKASYGTSEVEQLKKQLVDKQKIIEVQEKLISQLMEGNQKAKAS